MKVRFEFEIDPRKTETVDPRDVADCETIEAMELELLEWPNPEWRVSVNKDDLTALWAAVQALRQREGD